MTGQAVVAAVVGLGGGGGAVQCRQPDAEQGGAPSNVGLSRRRCRGSRGSQPVQLHV